MSMSSGSRRAASELVGWAFVLVSGALMAVYFSEIKAFMRETLGLPDPGTVVATDRNRANVADAEQPHRGGRRVELRAGRNGHFFAEIEINGRPVEVMVDSGASIIALTDEDARRAGIYVSERDYTHRVSTANGTARVAMVTLDRVSLGPIQVRNVRAAIAEPGKMDTTLLGMSFLSRVRTSTADGRMVLEE